MKQRLVILFVILFPALLFSQESNFGIKWSGFVKTDVFYDSRQTLDLREGHFLLYPLGELLDADKNDINAKPSFSILSVQSRLKGDITGPDALGAKATGMIEGEFFGTSNADLNGFRLRHAIVKLNWTNTELFAGQFWHPMFVTECFPEVVSFNTGAPFQPFSRNPQIRLTQKFGGLKFLAALIEERDFQDLGPNGSSTEYLRNSAMPEISAQASYSIKNEDQKTEFLFGIGANSKTITPRIKTTKGYQTDETVSGTSFMGWAKLKLKPVTIKLEAVSGEMLNSMTMIGGYGMTEITDTTKGFEAYSPAKTTSYWFEIMGNGTKWQPGLFVGYSQNNGVADKFTTGQTFYSRGNNIDYLYRISPRMVYNSGKVRCALELEYSVAAYGKPDETGKWIDEYGVITNSEEIANFRALVGIFYFF